MRNNEGRTQISPELLEQFMKQQEEKIVGPQSEAPTPAPVPRAPTNSGYQVPTDFAYIPSEGKFYPEGHPWKGKDRVEVRYMTTREEDILTNQGYAKAGVLFDKLIESVTVDRVDVDSLFPGDKNAVILNARKNSYGEEYKFAGICSNCLTEFEHTINLSEIDLLTVDDNNITNNNTCVVELPVSKKIVEIKLATSGDIKNITKQVELRKKHKLHVSETAELHKAMIISVDGNPDVNHISNFISQMLIKDSKHLKKKYEEFKPDVDFSYVHSCTECSHENRGGVPIGANFFWADD